MCLRVVVGHSAHASFWGFFQPVSIRYIKEATGRENGAYPKVA